MNSYKFTLLLVLSLVLNLFSALATKPTTVAKQTLLVKDSANLVKTVKGFLTWYKENYVKANDFALTGTNSKGNFTVDQNSCGRYLQFLKSSGYISDIYVLEWRKFFKSKAQYFVEFPQNEGPPYGFDLDLVLITQEPELVLNAINELKCSVKERNKNTAIIKVVGAFSYEFELSLVRGRWKIDYISTMNYD